LDKILKEMKLSSNKRLSIPSHNNNMISEIYESSPGLDDDHDGCEENLKQDICKMLEIDENHPDTKITA
jgi:hypothetical protein